MNASEAMHTRDLAQRLSEAEATIKPLLSGEIDAVVDSRTSAPLLLSKAQDALRESVERLKEAEFAENNDWIKRYLRKEMYVTAFSADEARRIAVESDPMVQRAVESMPKANALVQSAHRVIVQRLSK